MGPVDDSHETSATPEKVEVLVVPMDEAPGAAGGLGGRLSGRTP